MSRFNLSSISRLFSSSTAASTSTSTSASNASRTDTSSNGQARRSGQSKSASTGAALARLNPRASQASPASSAGHQRPRAGLPGAAKKKVSWAPDTPENQTLAGLMDQEQSTDLTKWGLSLKRELKRQPIDDPELLAIQRQIGRNKAAAADGVLYSDDSDSDSDSGSDSDSEIRPAPNHSALDMNAIMRQAGLLDE